MTRRAHTRRPPPRAGQIILVAVFLLLGLLLLALMNVDYFLTVRAKNETTDAGDAAALAAARWQGIALNTIGAINLAHLDLMCEYADDPDAALALSSGLQALQERLAFALPLMGCRAANRYAAENGAEEDADMRTLVREAAQRATYVLTPTDTWPTKGADVSAMIDAAYAEGVFCGVDNARLYDLNIETDHPLYAHSFYEAVAGEDWCWFFFRPHYLALLQNFSGWDALPDDPFTVTTYEPEFLGCDIYPSRGNAFYDEPVFLDLANRFGLSHVTPDTLRRAFFPKKKNPDGSAAHYWWHYNTNTWRAWDEMHRDGETKMPLLSDVRPEYDVMGACAAIRVTKSVTAQTPGVGTHEVRWTAAAKPFGKRDTSFGLATVIGYSGDAHDAPFTLITPDFTDVRLIPLAGANEHRLGTANLDWIRHLREHVPGCIAGRTYAPCPYCAALKRWNDEAFRKRGTDWLAENSGTCRWPSGSTSGIGGTRHAH